MKWCMGWSRLPNVHSIDFYFVTITPSIHYHWEGTIATGKKHSCSYKATFTSVRTNFCTDKNLHGSSLRLHGTGGPGRIFERLIGYVYTAPENPFCTDKYLHGSSLRLHGTGRTGRIFERLSVQVWDLLFSGSKLAHLAVQMFVQFRRSRVNARWNRASFCPCKNLSGPVYTWPKMYNTYMYKTFDRSFEK